MQPCIVILALWGVLVGFIGWTVCFRLAQPVASWLLEERVEASRLAGLVRLVVTLFGLFGMLLLLRVSATAIAGEGCGVNSKTSFGIVFIASLIGLVLFGLIRRLALRARR